MAADFGSTLSPGASGVIEYVCQTKPSRNLTDDSRQLDQNPLLVPDNIVAEGIRIYFERMYCQPCSLLSHLRIGNTGSAETPTNMILYPLLALSLQTTSDDSHESSQMCHSMANKAWELLVDAYSSSAFGEDYFEAVCLLAQRDFAGKPNT